MARRRDLISDFSGGEWSPRLRLRVDSPRYASACSQILNAHVLPQGGVISRCGMRLIEDITEFAADAWRLMVFRESDRDYVLLLAGGEMRVYKDGKKVSPFDVATPWSDDALETLDWAEFDGKMYVVSEFDEPQVIERYGINLFSVTPVSFEQIPQYAFGDADSPAATDATDEIAFTGAWANGDTFRIETGSGDTPDLSWSADSETLRIRIRSALRQIYLEPDAGLSGGVDVTGAYPTYTVSWTGDYSGFQEPLNPVVVSSTAGTFGAGTYTPGTGTILEDSWSATRGWPRTVSAWQQRLIFCGTDSQPQHFWGSVPGSPTDFTTGPNDNDAIVHRIWGKEQFTIQWIGSKDSLMIGTTRGDWVAAGDGLLAPATVGFKNQNSYRSATDRPVLVGSEVFYTELDGHTLRTFEYEWGAQSWQSRDISFTSEHLLRSGIFDLCYVELDSPILFAVRQDGAMAALTYLRNQQVASWHQIVTRGNIKAATVALTGNTHESLYVVVERNGIMTLEWIQWVTPSYVDALPENGDSVLGRNGNTLESYLDASIIDQSGSATITGLSHLNGQSVMAVIDDKVTGPYTVASDSITLTETGDRVVVGLPYTVRIKTHPPNGGIPRGQRWIDPTIRVFGSYLPKVNGHRPSEATASTPMGSAQAMIVEGDFRVQSFGHDDGAITIEMDLPLPIGIAGVFGYLEVNA